MRGLLSRCRIGGQIALLGVVGLAGMLTVAGIDWWGAGRLARSEAVADRMRQMQATETAVQVALLQARRSEKDFLLRHDAASVEKQGRATEAALRDSQALADRAADLPDLAEPLHKMTGDIPRYGAQFASVVQHAKAVGLTENDGLLGALRTAVHEVEDRLKSVGAADAQIAMLMMRRNEKDFLARLDPQYGAAVQAQLAGFTAAIDAADLPVELKRELTAKMSVYQDAVARLVTERLVQQGETTKLSTLYAEIEPNLATVDQRFAARAEQAVRDSEALRAATSRLVVWSIVLVTGVMLAASWLLGRGIARPIVSVTRCMEALTRGDLAAQVPSDDRRDEIGTMMRTVQAFKDSLIESARLREEQSAASQRAAAERNAALAAMAEKIEAEAKVAIQEVGGRIAVMDESADGMSASAERTGASAESAAAAAGQALSNAQTVASAAEQLTASIHEIGGQVHRSNAVVAQAVEAGRATRDTIAALNEQVGRIGSVADMISEIAARTNLLALNATIEAARAGDAGKGFAVVASEVKQLATQTARSTEEIGRHIAEVRGATGASVAAVSRIEETIGEINTIAGSIAAAVEQQGAATAEIARNVTETASAANAMSGRIAEVSAEAVTTGKHAAEVKENSAAVNGAINELRHVIIRVVRTSTSEVDRRGERRRPCLAEASISCDGQSGTATVHDISEQGCVAATTLRCQTGSRVEIGMSRFGKRLSGHVAEWTEAGVHIHFDGGIEPAEADRIALATVADMVDLTKSDHMAFVKRVADAVASQEKLAPQSLATYQHCRLGRWYYAVSDQATLALPSFQSLSEPHNRVHDAGRRALVALAAGDMTTAQSCVTEMRANSDRVMSCLDQFGREFPATVAQRHDQPEAAAA
jgi:methyl-accepting chemotaxis protein